MNMGKSFFLPGLFTCAILQCALTARAGAADNRIHCYRIPGWDRSSPAEVWCYQRLTNQAGPVSPSGRSGRTFIFNADGGEVRPETSLILENDGTLVHGSLLNGRISVQRVQSRQFNPYSVPLEEPRDGAALRAPLPEGPGLRRSAKGVLDLLSAPMVAAKAKSFPFQAGMFTARAAAKTLPWRGFSWPNLGLPLAATWWSPMAKYDKYMEGRTGRNPGSRDWEGKHHTARNLVWRGHCNGWAASAILRHEPKVPRRDPRTGTVFSVSDQKGLMAETDYCAKAAFFGRRYNHPGDDLHDIDPATFHKALIYYIGTLGKPLAVDYYPNEIVDTHVISGYSITIDGRGAVTADLVMHAYDEEITDQPGPAPSYAKTYSYTLTKDAAGNISGGTWQTENPDFLWAPLGFGICRSNNPNVTLEGVESILQLPVARE
jgi:hypothetical protein